MMVGGFGQAKAVTDEIRAICDDIRPQVENNLSKSFNTWEPVNFKTQVVAGTNYKVKVKVSDNEFIHVKVFKPLPHTGEALSLTEVTEGHNESEEI
jgi:cystatin-A/B